MTEGDRDAVRRRRGYWIRQARELRGWGQKELAAALGYESNVTGNISKWEKGTRPVPSDMFTPLARALGLPADFLVDPPETDEERLDAAIRRAGEMEQRDWASGADRFPAAGDGPGGEPGRRTA